ncbi:MAG TPA: peptidylprolyl isomerase [Kofleriaceae bacterium]|nr:peptidylprolyl isomerase [Kofleriaceae bacterium]
MNRPVLALIATAVLGALGGCSGSKAGPTINNKMSGSDQPPAAATVSSVVSSDILAREPIANTATVKHILISWHDLGEQFGGRLDPRADKRSKADAEAEVRSLLKQLQDGADFDAVMKAHSEDLGSAMSGRTFTVTPDAQLVIEFRQLSLRLRPGEFGVCQSDFGFHIIKRFS